VTGASGLLGRCLVTRLRAAGRAVRLLDVLLPPPELLGPDVEARQGDMRDAALVREAARGVEVIYHCAAGQRMKPQFAAMSEDEILAMNVALVRHVVDAAAAEGVRKLVHVSSSGVYGVPTTRPVREDHPQRPLGAYGRSKIEGERLCLAWVARGGDVTVLRPMSLFGPHMSGVFLLLFDWVHRGKNVWLLGNGRNTIQMVSAWDVADACLLAATTPGARGAVLNVGGPGTVTVRGQVEGLLAHARSSSRVVPLPAWLVRNGARALGLVGLSPIVPEHYLLADATFVLDTTRAREVLGWAPRFDDVQLMTEAYDWFVAHADAVAPRSPVLSVLDALS